MLQPMVTEATETNSEDTGDSEGAVSKAYARFKPLAGVYTHSAAARQDGEPETSGSGAERGRVFYGHDGYYVFFRLHQCLYERWALHQLCRTCCEDKGGLLTQTMEGIAYSVALKTPATTAGVPLGTAACVLGTNLVNVYIRSVLRQV